MKKSLLFAAAALLVVSAGNAQVRRFDLAKNVDVKTPELIKQKPAAKVEFAQMNENKKTVRATKVNPKANVIAWYNRPAGAFYLAGLVKNGDYAANYTAPVVFMKPFAKYTWKNASEGAESYEWTYNYWGGEGYLDATTTDVDYVSELEMEMPGAPTLKATAGGESDEFTLYRNTFADKEWTKNEGFIISSVSADNWSSLDGYRFFSTARMSGDRHQTTQYGYSYYSGATPHGNNQEGWWFGKCDNGLDAICQVYERPEHPYALKSVAVDYGTFKVDPETGGTLTANVYRLKQDPPQYVNGENVVLMPEDMELLTSTTIQVDTTSEKASWLIFPMMATDEGLTFESSYHIDFPILVEITGYNAEPVIDEEAGALTYADNGILDFSGLVTSDLVTDEGFGETAYIKRYVWYGRDTDNNPYLLDNPHYEYEGVNNFFTSGEMKAGFAINLEVEYPFMVYNYTAENGEYTFPAEGGSYTKTFGEGSQAVTLDAISIFSWNPSDDWTILTTDGEDVPEWLTIEPEDMYDENDEFTGEVNVTAVAEPLPEGVTGRECTVSFSYTGAELTYHFIQGEISDIIKGDVNGDGAVNVSDVTALVNMILGVQEKDEARADVDGNGVINVSDVTALVNIILGVA
ncbi:MAG: dockerin type I repeat-containing protein [Muribaculaceae bacterium]|nr:dockerin type I repeat-containing protein [Muribaculaceae bacterium]